MAKRLAWLKPAVAVGGLVPLAAISYRAARGDLGANPIAEALNRMGLLALVFLVLSLACTPLQIVFGYNWPLRVRRMLGLLAFFYGSLHVLTYAGLDQIWDWESIVIDIAKRPFILVGFMAWLLMVPLALTSTKGMLQRLGFQRWKRLHRLAYLSALLGVVHFVMRVKKDVTEPALYGAALGLLLLVRVVDALRAVKRRAPAR
jgi:methionine sulfoxide reductase heme-binding subunit